MYFLLEYGETRDEMTAKAMVTSEYATCMRARSSFFLFLFLVQKRLLDDEKNRVDDGDEKRRRTRRKHSLSVQDRFACRLKKKSKSTVRI